MAATAAALGPRMGGPATALQRLRSVDMPLSPDRLALSHFLAAIHNAHYGQDQEDKFADFALFDCIVEALRDADIDVGS